MDKKNKIKKYRLQGNEALKKELLECNDAFVALQALQAGEAALLDGLCDKAKHGVFDPEALHIETGKIGRGIGPKSDLAVLSKQKEYRVYLGLLLSELKLFLKIQEKAKAIQEKYSVSITAFNTSPGELPEWEPCGPVNIIKHDIESIILKKLKGREITIADMNNFFNRDISGFSLSELAKKTMDDTIVKNGKLMVEIDLENGDTTDIINIVGDKIQAEKKKRGLVKGKGNPKSAYHKNKKELWIEIFLRHYCSSKISTGKAIDKTNEELQKQGIDLELTLENFNKHYAPIIRQREGVSDIRHLKKQDK